MLSRVADCLYWMSRYLERAEHTARLLDVRHYQGLDQRIESAERHWARLLAALRAPAPDGRADAYGITKSLVADAANSASIVSCVGAARDNARQVREQISSEMWEQLNRLYLHVRGASIDELWDTEPHEFFKVVREGAHLFQGITDATMSHGEGWHFIQLGRYIERAGATTALLDPYYAMHQEALQGEAPPLDYLEWVGLLKSCTAFEAYCKVYTADVRPDRIADFLLFDAEFPRSLRFMAAAIQVDLQTIARATGVARGRAERLAGRLRATLDYSGLDEIMGETMHGYLEGIGLQCAATHTAVYQTYILQQHFDGRRRWIDEPEPIGSAVQANADLTGSYSEQQQQSGVY